MRAAQLQHFNDWLAGTALLNDRLWQRELAQISEMEIQLFYARAGLKGARAQAIEAIDRLQSTLILKAVEGQLSQADLRLIEHEIPEDVYCVDEFIDGLAQLTQVRRAAALFALEQHMTAEQVIDLSWSAALALNNLKDNARAILAKQFAVRHLRLPYVFWEWKTPIIATCLTGLEDDVQQAMGKRWPGLQVSFDSMLWLSGRADAASFLELTQEVISNRVVKSDSSTGNQIAG